MTPLMKDETLTNTVVFRFASGDSSEVDPSDVTTSVASEQFGLHTNTVLLLCLSHKHVYVGCFPRLQASQDKSQGRQVHEVYM